MQERCEGVRVRFPPPQTSLVDTSCMGTYIVPTSSFYVIPSQYLLDSLIPYNFVARLPCYSVSL